MPAIPFFKLSGAGNDFVALVEPTAPPPAEAVRAWCRRGLAIGADGVFVLTRTQRGARMVHYNADGGRSELCLNGSRCAAQLAFHLGWSGETTELLTDAGPLAVRRVDETRVGLELPPIVSEPERRVLSAGGEAYEGWYVVVGVPHFVLPWPEGLDKAPVAELGPTLRSHPDLGDAGANVDFVYWRPPSRVEIRTFERGVEGETLACGTGVVATAAAAVAAGELETPVRALTSGDFELVVEGDPRRPVLVGDARVVARGEILPGAFS